MSFNVGDLVYWKYSDDEMKAFFHSKTSHNPLKYKHHPLYLGIVLEETKHCLRIFWNALPKEDDPVLSFYSNPREPGFFKKERFQIL